MSEADQRPAGESDPVEPTAGAMLRAAREASGLHIAALAVALKVPVKKLEALETDRLDLLPDAVFVRALAASVCRTLKIDPQTVLGKLPGTVTPRLHHNDVGLNAPFRTPGEGPSPGWKDQFTRPVMLMVVALLLGALVLIFLPDMPGVSSQSVREPEPVAVLSVNPAFPPAVSAGVAVAPSGPALPIPEAALPAPPLASAIPVATSRGTSAASAVDSSAIVLGAGDSGLVMFKTRGDSWIEVTDAKGQVALRRIVSPGESASANGALPLAVTVGKADVTLVSVRGKLLDLAPLSRDNVARFEVK